MRVYYTASAETNRDQETQRHGKTLAKIEFDAEDSKEGNVNAGSRIGKDETWLPMNGKRMSEGCLRHSSRTLWVPEASGAESSLPCVMVRFQAVCYVKTLLTINCPGLRR